MKLLVDYDRSILISSLGNRTPQTLLEIKRSYSRVFSVQFVSGLAVYELDPAPAPAATIKIGAKAHDDFSGPFDIYTADFTKVGTDITTVYTSAPILSNVSLNDLFVVGGVSQIVDDQAARYALVEKTVGTIVRQTSDQTYWIVKDASHLGDSTGWSSDVPEKEYVDLDAELKWQVGSAVDATFTFTLRIWNNLIQDDNGLPTTVQVFPAGQFVATVPANDGDFSMFPGAVAPANGLFFAAELTKLWVFNAQAGWNAWRHAIIALSA